MAPPLTLRAIQKALNESSKHMSQDVISFFQKAENTPSEAKHKSYGNILYRTHQPIPYSARVFLLRQERKMIEQDLLAYESEFEELFLKALAAAFDRQKGTPVTSIARVIDAVVIYLGIICVAGEQENMDRDSEDLNLDTFASRFIVYMLSFLHHGAKAINKDVRHWVQLTAAEIAGHLGQVDESKYFRFRVDMIRRLNDKEPGIRANAVRALCARAAGIPDEGITKDQQEVLDHLLVLLEEDDAAEVRKAVIERVPFHNETRTQEAFLLRLRDIDEGVRRHVFIRLMKEDIMLSKSQRNQVVLAGFKDRDPGVNKSARQLVYVWFNRLKEKVKGEDNADVALNNYFTFIDTFDLLGNPEPANLALNSVFLSQQNVKDSDFRDFEFGANFWHTLTYRHIFVARVYIEYLNHNEAASQVVFSELGQELEIAEAIERQHERELYTNPYDLLVFLELLKIALILDYSSLHAACGKMLATIGKVLSNIHVPPAVQLACMSVLPKLIPSSSERVQYMVPLLSDIYAPGEEDEGKDEDADVSFTSSPVKRKPLHKPVETMNIHEKVEYERVQLSCLRMACALLEDINDTLDNNNILKGLFFDLINDNLDHYKPEIQELAYKSYGMMILIDNNVALYLKPMIEKMAKSVTGRTKLVLNQLIFDVLAVYGRRLLVDPGTTIASTDDILKQLREQRAPSAKATMALGLAKLMLLGTINDDVALLELIICYFHNSSDGNEELRQSLAVFFPWYSRCSPKINKYLFAETLVPAFRALYTERSQTKTPPLVLTQYFLDWTNPQQIVAPTNASNEEKEEIQEDCKHIQMIMANNIIQSLLDANALPYSNDAKKALTKMLTLIITPETYERLEAMKLVIMLNRIETRGILSDKTSKDHIANFKNKIMEAYDAKLEGVSESEWRKMEELNAVFEYLDAIFVEEDDDETFRADDEADMKPRNHGSKRRRTRRFISDTATSDDDAGTSSGPPKRRRVSGTPTSDGFQPRGSSTRSKSVFHPNGIEEIAISSDSTSDSFEPISPPPLRAKWKEKSKDKGRARAAPPETLSAIDRDIDLLLEGSDGIGDDSIMGPVDSSPEVDTSADEVEGMITAIGAESESDL